MRALVVACLVLASCDGQVRFEADDAAIDSSAPEGDTSSPSPCKVDGDCPFASLHCDIGTSTCVPCLVDLHCAAHSEMPRCDGSTHTCVECNLDADCGSTGHCDQNRCLRPCHDGDDCSGETPSCNPTRKVCTCTSSSCSSGERPRCDASVGICVQCVGDGDCTGEHHRCVRGECVPCRIDRDCPGKRCDPIRNECVD